jgi:hypothetical protein
MPLRQELESGIARSRIDQSHLESGGKILFEDYLENYFRLS